jgi:hypothetical protein
MMNRKVNQPLFLVACLFFAQHYTAQNSTHTATIKKIFDYTLTRGKAYDNLHYLCKNIGQRLSGSKAMYLAEAWGLQTMKNAKADNAYLQQCLVPVWQHKKDEKVSATWSGEKGGKLKIAAVALGNSEGTGGKTIQGTLVVVHNYEELEAKHNELAGKIILYNYPFDQTRINTFNGYRDAVTYRGSGASRAAKYGAAAVLIRSVSTAADNHPHTGSVRYNDSFPRIPAIAIGTMHADQLATLATKSEVTIKLKSTSTMLADAPAHNVIGEIKGSLYPEKIITVGGHLDSWDIGEGAHDDGAGIVQSIELINIFHAIGYTPKHTVRVVLFANEENGLRGGNKYADEAAAKNEIHIAAIESDAGGFSPRAFNGTMSEEQYMKFASWLPYLKPYGITDMGKGGGGADIGPLQQKFKTPIIGLSPDGQRYFDLHHCKTDVFEAVNKRELHLGAAAMAALVYLIDNEGL